MEKSRSPIKEPQPRRTKKALAAFALLVAVATGCSPDEPPAPEGTININDTSPSLHRAVIDVADQAAQGYLQSLGDNTALVDFNHCDSLRHKSGNFTVILNPGHIALRHSVDGSKLSLRMSMGIEAGNPNDPKPTDEEIASTGTFAYKQDNVTVLSVSKHNHIEVDLKNPQTGKSVAYTDQIDMPPGMQRGKDGRWSHLSYIPMGVEDGGTLVVPVLKQAEFSGPYNEGSVYSACLDLKDGFPTTMKQVHKYQPLTTGQEFTT